MPTHKPRINVTVTQDQYDRLHQLSTATEESMSSIMSEMLEAMIPTFERMYEMVKAAENAPKEMVDSILERMESSQSKLVEAQRGALDAFDDLVPKRTVLPAQRAAARGSVPRPPTTNRGVNSHHKSIKNCPVLPMKTKK